MTFFKKLNQHTKFIEFLLMVAIVISFDIIFVVRYGFALSFRHWLVAFFNAGVIVSLLMLIKTNKRRFIAYIIFVLIMFTFFVTDSTLYYFKRDVTSIAMLLESGKNTMKIGLKYNPLKAYNVFIWIGIVTLLFYGLKAVRRLVMHPVETRHNKLLIKLVYLFVCAFGLIFSPKIVNQNDLLLFQTPADKALFVQKFGSISYHVKDIVSYTSNAILPKLYRNVLLEELASQIDTERAMESPVFGQYAGMNVIMIMCETCEEYAFSPEHTPNYYRLMEKSIYYNRFYSAAKSNYTYDAEFKSLTSMMYFQADNFMYTYGRNAYPNALPNLLRGVGYTAHSFHNYYGTFFNRNIIHESIGFEHYYAVEELDIEPGDYWPLDSMMFDQFKDLIVPVQEDPFFSFIITVTPHGPHNKYRNELAEYYDKLAEDPLYQDESMEYLTITAAQMDFDKGLGHLLDDLEAKGLMDETIIVLFSDHKNYSSLELTMEKTPNSDLPYEIEKVPMLIYLPHYGGDVSDILTSHYDITPTLTDLLGIPIYHQLYYGQSLFLPIREDRPIILSYSSWIDENEMVEFDQVVDGTLEPEEYMVKKMFIYATIEYFEKLFFSDYFNSPNPFFPYQDEQP